MIRTLSFILLTVFLFPAAALPQSRLDSLENLLDSAGPEEKVEIFCDISELYWQRSYDTSLLMASHALNVAEELESRELMATPLNMMGIAFYLIGDFASAMDYYFRALALNEELKDSSSIAILYNNIGAVYIDLKDYQNALAYLKNAREIYNILGNTEYMFSNLNNIGTAYIDLEQFDTAYQYLTDAYDFALETQNRTDASIALNNLGEVTLTMGLYDKSGEFYSSALEISKSLDDKAMMATLFGNLGHLHLEKAEYETAFNYFMEGLAYAETVNSLTDKREIYKYLAQYHETMEDEGQALQYYKLYNNIRDSILSEEDRMSIKEMEISSNARKLHQEIQLLRMENEINSLKQTRLKILIFLFGASALLGIFVFVIYFQKNRFKRETNRLLEEKNQQLEKTNKKLKDSETHLMELNATKDKFFSIISHDLRNPLNALLGLSELISGESSDCTLDEIRKYSKIINEAAKNIHLLVENLLEWSRSQSGNIEFDPKVNEIHPILKETVDMFGIQAKQKNIKIDVSVPERTVAYTDKHLLSAILRNLINNAVKFTHKGGKINILSEISGKELILSVKDSGVGMTEEQATRLFYPNSTVTTMPGTTAERGTGLGLILCKEFTEMHGGKIWVESKPGKGSTFSFTLPLQK